MRALKITENNGLYVVETTAGVRTSGASLQSALEKMLVTEEHERMAAPVSKWDGIEKVFDSIKPIASGQIASGQASA